jgi:putative multicomponent Na+:H+ antiporter subunit B
MIVLDSSDSYILPIVALLPLTALMLVVQTNPYHALVIRGILGAIAALVYSVLGAADVALTEALMGTLLAITLYAIAVRSSLVLQLGVLVEPGGYALEASSPELEPLRQIAHRHYLQLEVLPYATPQALTQALAEGDIHAACWVNSPDSLGSQGYPLQVRIPRLYEIFTTELPTSDGDQPLPQVSFFSAPPTAAVNG